MGSRIQPLPGPRFPVVFAGEFVLMQALPATPAAAVGVNFYQEKI